jgi:ADP-ribosylglycohydrolase
MWDVHARALFGGEGSLGNGAAMRAAPLGAWFSRDLGLAREQARLAAEVTHAHPEGISAAVAVALAAASAAAGRADPAPDPRSFLEQAAGWVPGPVGDGIARAAALSPGTPAWQAADLLGNGQRVRPATPSRSPCGTPLTTSMTSPEPCGLPLRDSATSTRPARSPPGSSPPAPGWPMSRPPGSACASRFQTGPRPVIHLTAPATAASSDTDPTVPDPTRCPAIPCASADTNVDHAAQTS